MRVQTKRDSEFLELSKVTIEIGNYSYRISESVDGQLVVNKISHDGTDDYMRVYPRSGNEIQVS